MKDCLTFDTHAHVSTSRCVDTHAHFNTDTYTLGAQARHRNTNTHFDTQATQVGTLPLYGAYSSRDLDGFQKPWLIAGPSHCQAMVNGFGLAQGLRKPEPPGAKP